MPEIRLKRLSTPRMPAGNGARPLRWMAAAALMLCLQGASAEEDVQAWAARHAPGTIQSVEMADQVLLEAEAERQQIEARYRAEQNLCYDKFFTSNCLNEAAERHRTALKLVRPVEIEANAYKRRAKVDERDRNLAEQQLRDQQEAAQRAEQQRQKQAETAAKMERSAREAQAAAANSKRHEGAAQKRVAEHEARLKKAREEEAANAAQRERNIAEYEKKRQASEARQREIAANKAEKARKKAAEQGTGPAAAPPATSPTPAPPAAKP